MVRRAAGRLRAELAAHAVSDREARTRDLLARTNLLYLRKFGDVKIDTSLLILC